MGSIEKILLILFFCTQKSAVESCLLRYDNKMIVLTGQKKSYETAEADCHNIKESLLVTIDEKEKQDEIIKVLKSKGIAQGPYWIGLSDRLNEGEWRYSDGSPLGKFSSWAPNEPNNLKNEDCVALTDSGKWLDLDCSSELTFLCEFSEINKDCSYESLSIPNAFYEKCHEAVSFSHGKSFTFNCHDGYKIKGSGWVSCDDGKWKVRGECLPTCSPPFIPDNIRIVPSKEYYFIEEEAVFECKDGFFIQENKPKAIHSMKCLGVDTWSSHHLHCVSRETFHAFFPGNTHKLTVFDITNLETLILNCSDSNDDSNKYKYTWEKNSEIIEGAKHFSFLYSITKTGQLHLKTIDESSVGIYTCLKQEKNSNEFKGVFSYSLMSEGKNCKISNEKTVLEFREREATILNCGSFRANLTPFVWIKNGADIGYDDDHHLILPDGGLLLKRVNYDDAGDYVCMVTDLISSCVTNHTYVVSVKSSLENVCGKVPQIKEGVHPWFVSFWWDDETNPFCYGTLISEQWIASAASCFTNIRSTLYSHIRVKFNKNVNHETNLSISSVHIHPFFSKGRLINSISLIKLATPLSLNTGIWPLCLMSQETESTLTHQRKCELPKPPIKGYVLNLGPVESEEVEMVVLPKYKCNKVFSLPLNDSMFCSENVVNKSTVSVDIAGSPFAVEIKGKRYLYGIYSLKESSSKEANFDFFTKVSYFNDWIISYIKN